MRQLRIAVLLVLVVIFAGSSAAPAAAHGSDFTLRRGDAGAQVAVWQRMLNMWNGFPRREKPLLEDGIFGPVTEERTHDFERSPGIERPVDGIVTIKDRILWLGGFLTSLWQGDPPLVSGMTDPHVGHLSSISLPITRTRPSFALVDDRSP